MSTVHCIWLLSKKKTYQQTKPKRIKKSSYFQGECRQLVFPGDFTFGNRRLIKHSIEILKVLDFELCELQCYHQPSCVSINFNVIPNSEGLHECELNNATHRNHDSELMNIEGYVYKGAEVRNLNLFLSFTEKKNDDKISLTRESCFMSLSGRFMLDFGYEFVKKFGLTFGFRPQCIIVFVFRFI